MNPCAPRHRDKGMESKSLDGRRYLDTYLPREEFFSLSRSGGQIIIAAETNTGGTKPTNSAGAKENWRYAKVYGQLEGMDLVTEFFSRKSMVSGIPRTLRVRRVCGAVIRQLMIPLPTTTDDESRA